MNEVIISIKPSYVVNFLSGEKSVEIRNRSVRLTSGSRLWIYSTLPKGCIEAVAQVRKVEVGSPSIIWERYNESLALSRSTYTRYVNGSSKVSAILVGRIWKLPVDLSLSMLRSHIPDFHPPQFLRYMADSDPLFTGIVSLLYALSDSNYLQTIGIKQKPAA